MRKPALSGRCRRRSAPVARGARRMDGLVSATVFLAHAEDSRAMNEVYAGVFATPAPAVLGASG